jgi:hypothetical protein
MNRTLSQAELAAQDSLIAALQKSLDKRYVLLRNVSLEGLDVPIPVVLVGPTGVRMIYPSALRGIFRAKDDHWEKLDERSNDFQEARPNLLTRSLLMAKAVTAFLGSKGLPLPQVEPVLYFADPGLHVESTRPAVRIVLVDALDRFVAGILQAPAYQGVEEVEQITKALLGDLAQWLDAALSAETRDAFSFRESAPLEPNQSRPQVVMEKSEPEIIKGLPFTSRQLVVLGVLLLVNIVIVIVFLVYFLGTL